MTDLERAAMQNVRELRGALKAIREAVEELAPPGSVPSEEHLTPEPMREAEAIIRGIQAIADPAARERRAASSHNREGPLDHGWRPEYRQPRFNHPGWPDLSQKVAREDHGGSGAGAQRRAADTRARWARLQGVDATDNPPARCRRVRLRLGT